MTRLTDELDEYLALRRGLGFKLRDSERLLHKFIVFLKARSAEFVTTELALQWAQQPQHTSLCHRSRRLAIVRDFARYLSAKEPRTEIPPQDLLQGKTQRSQPYIYSDEQILRLIRECAALEPRLSLRPHTYAALFGLLAVTGMRHGEIIALKNRDVDLNDGMITVRQSKFNKTRILPVHPSTTKKLRAYVRCRDRLAPVRSTDRFFVSRHGKGLNVSIVRHAFIQVSRRIGLRAPDDTHGPRLHDLRHTFAVRTLTDWHRSGINPEQRLPLLSTYLGHVKVSDTYWYLSAVPELLGAVSTRLENFLGDLS
jgi:integrase/recombinase XerD